MSDQSVMTTQGRTWKPVSSASEAGKDTTACPRFSAGVTVSLSLICFACFGFLVFYHIVTPRLSRVSSPERALAIVANQVLFLKSGLADAPAWERQFNDKVAGGSADIDHLIVWYRELAARSHDPFVHLYLAVLEAERGHWEEVQSKIVFWRGQGPPYKAFAEWLRAAYFENPAEGARMRLQAQLAELLPDSWFYYQLAGRVAARSGDRLVGEAVQSVLEERGSHLVNRNRFVEIVQLSGLLCGGVTGGLLLWRRWNKKARMSRVGESMLPPPWPGWNGVTVLLRGGGLAAVLLFMVSLSGLDANTLQFLIPFLLHVPIVMLAVKDLFHPHGWTLFKAFGLKVSRQGWVRLLPVIVGLFGVGATGDWVLGTVAQRAQVTIHWTSWFDPALVNGDTFTIAAALLGYVVLAPVLEEMVFRGVIFATLRRTFGVWTSTLLSAGIFAVAHGYGLLGGLTIFWSGLLWAWAYEKTGSLWPGIIAHSLNNLLVCLAVVLLVRPG